MKNTIFLLTVFMSLCFTTVFSQDFNGKAIYKTHQKNTINFDSKNKTNAVKIQKSYNEFLKKESQKNYILNFDSSSSTYKEEQALSVPNSSSLKMKITVVGGGGANDILYKNLKNQHYLNQTEIRGKRFLVDDKLPTFNWKLTSETKNIGVYTCYKAIAEREVEKVLMKTINDEHVEEKVIKKITTTAWYTPQIPISNGPADYHGLPGLILEINEGNKTIVCTEIVLNPSQKTIIKKPKKGKKITQSDFDHLKREKTKEFLNQMTGRNGSMKIKFTN